MPRSEPYRTIDVKKRILAKLEPMRLQENKKELRPYSVNAYCEKILADFSDGKLIPLEGTLFAAKTPKPRKRIDDESGENPGQTKSG